MNDNKPYEQQYQEFQEKMGLAQRKMTGQAFDLMHHIITQYTEKK